MNNIDKKDINKKTDVYNSDMNIILNNTDYISFITTKAQKIVTALYLVTGNMSDTEPLKSTLRQKSLELIGVTHNMGMDAMFSKKDKIAFYLEHIKSLLIVAEQTGYVSEMNSHILQREINKLMQTIHGSEKGNEVREGGVLPEGFFDVESLREGTRGGLRAHEQGEDTQRENQKDIKDNNLYKTDNVARNSEQNRTQHTPQVKRQKEIIKPRKQNRREFILSIITKKKEVNIKDISDVFDGCSEKTIQRELTSLVEDGVVRKEGERRWSRYRLV